MAFDPKEGLALLERRRRTNDVYSHQELATWFSTHARKILWRLGGDGIITVPQLDELHADLNRFALIEPQEKYIGLSVDYSRAEVESWPAVQRALIKKLRDEDAAAVAFWDSNQACWSSGPRQASVYDCYTKGFWMVRGSKAFTECEG